MTDEHDGHGGRPAPATEGYGVSLRGDGSDHLSFGVDTLDRALGGGFPPGDLVAVAAPPTSQSERLLYTLAGNNPTRYLSTLRPPVEVNESLAAVGIGPLADAGADADADGADGNDGEAGTDGADGTDGANGPDGGGAGEAGDGGIEVRQVAGDDLLDDAATHLSELAPRSVVVVDPATELERAGEDRYRAFLSTLKRHLRATESVGVLHCLRAAPRPLRRDLTLARADVTLDVSREVDESGVEHHLTVGKYRRGRASTDRIQLSFHGGTEVVHTRDIA